MTKRRPSKKKSSTAVSKPLAIPPKARQQFIDKLPPEHRAFADFLLDGLFGGKPLDPLQLKGSRLSQPEAFVDPSRLFSSGLFNAYNPSVLVTRRGLSVFDQMKLDEQVKLALAFKKLACLASGWTVESPDDQEDDWEVTRFVKDVFTNFEGGWANALKKILRALEYGFAVPEKIFSKPQEAPAWAPGRVVLTKLNDVKQHYIDFENDAYGNVIAIVQRWTPGSANSIPEKRFPPDKFVHFAYDQEHENPYGKSDLEAAYRAWWTKDNAYKWFAIMLERYGLPPFFALYDPNDYQGDQVEALKRVVKNIQNSTMGIIPRSKPEGLEFWSQQLSTAAKEIFVSALSRFDLDIAKAILMPSHIGGTSESRDQGSGGSFARSNVHFKMFMFVISELQENLAEVVNSKIVKQLCDLNFAGLKSYPRFRLLDVDDEVETKIFELWEKLVTGKIVGRLPDDETHIRAALGMPKNDSPTLEPLPSDAALEASKEKDAQAAGKEGKEPAEVPEEQQTEEMRQFAEENGCNWRMINGHPVCIRSRATIEGGGDMAGGGGNSFKGMEEIVKAFEPARKEIAGRYETQVESIFNNMQEELGPELKGVSSSWRWARTFRSLVSPYVDREGDQFRGPAFLNRERLSRGAEEYANAALREAAAKAYGKLGDLSGLSASYHGNFGFRVSGSFAGKRVLIDQNMIINVSSRGTLFNQWPSRIYVDGKFMSEKDYKKLRGGEEH